METRQNNSFRDPCSGSGMDDSDWTLDLSGLVRSIRRHHRSRLLKRREYYYNHRNDARVVDTPTPCSCWMCGNPRRFSPHPRTIQELKADLDLHDALSEV